MSARPLVLIVAVARNGVIGGDNRLLWRLKGDMAHFRRCTMGKPLIMGRKTFESIGKPLPGREMIVLTRDPEYRPDGVLVAADLQAALKLAEAAADRVGAGEIVVAGGGEIYRQTLDKAARIEMTEVALEPDGDTYFPEMDPGHWQETRREPHLADREAGDEADYVFVTYDRITNGRADR
ncbi:MAG: dihydrofolate reductase family protein [Hyphomicrobiales bacterium]|nr:dihydrofolate reductase family protein [Hyphomicrobiales bacterium]